MTSSVGEIASKLYPDAPTPPPNAGIRFAGDKGGVGEQ